MNAGFFSVFLVPFPTERLVDLTQQAHRYMREFEDRPVESVLILAFADGLQSADDSAEVVEDDLGSIQFLERAGERPRDSGAGESAGRSSSTTKCEI